jgi:hypothetical protein
MNPTLEKKIIQKYGSLLDAIIDQDILFECGDGWFEIIDSFCFMASHMMSTPQYLKLIEKNEEGKTHKQVRPLKVHIIKVEEIGGGLSIQYEIIDNTGQDYSDCEQEGVRARANMVSSYIGALADMCEYNSSKTCEECGSPAKGPRSSGNKTLCPDHQKNKMQNEQQQT